MTPLGSAPRILVVEDEFILATDLTQELQDAGIGVIGPASTLQQGQDLCRDFTEIDGAVLDISLHGEMVFPLADELLRHDIPFLFATGYDAEAIPRRFQHIERHAKPIYVDRIIAALGGPASRHA